MPLKILHTGDLHLGMTFRNRSYPEDLRKTLVKARFETLQGLVERANGEKCQLFIVAGDLFHRTNVSRETVLRAAEILSGFNGNCVAVLPGNHDYLEGFDSLWKTFRENALDHLLVLEETSPYSLEDYNLEAVLYPAPCHRKHSPENRLGWIRELEEKLPGKWHLGIAHGSVKGISPDFDSRYFPMEEEEFRDLDLDHWCLGHTHVRYPDSDSSPGIVFAYCGTPEPDGFDCRHGGFARLTTLGDEGDLHSLSLVETGCFRFREIEREVKSAGDLHHLKRELAGEGANTLVRLSLGGVLPREDYHSRHEILEELKEELAYLEVDDSEMVLEISPETISAEFPRDSFPYLLLSRLADRGEKEALQQAYQLVRKVKKDDHR